LTPSPSKTFKKFYKTNKYILVIIYTTVCFSEKDEKKNLEPGEKLSRKKIIWNPSYTEGVGRRIEDLIQKITKAKKGWGMSQVVEHLLSKWKATCSNPSTTIKKEI
jgi:hypothetical protein